MSAAEYQKLIDEYITWLKTGLSLEMVGTQVAELTTPFLDHHNDHLQIYVNKSNGKLVLTDDGYVLNDLQASGFEFDTPRRRAILESTLNGFGVKLYKNDLRVEASAQNLGQRLHSLIQAMLALDDMYVISKPRVTGFFWEDVANFLTTKDVRYSANVKVSGKSGYDHHIDFMIPKSKQSPERFLQAINTPTKSTIGNFLFVITDSVQARPQPAEAMAFLNDQDKPVGGDVIEALGAYSIRPILWSQREQHVEELAN